jgi:DNA-binding NarL/FixJ family response regulator/class 3 adenylate cyclase
MGQVVTAAVLFTDIVGSTEILGRVGADANREIHAVHFALLRDTISAHGGHEVKRLGDGVMATFPSAADALTAAITIQQGVDRQNLRSTEPLSIRIGVAVGDATYEDGDYFGDPVIEASRLCAMAEGGQIIATDAVRLMAKGHVSHAFSPLGDVTLKGMRDPVAAIEVAWDAKPDLLGIAIVEDHPLYRQGLVQAIETTAEMEVVAVCRSIEEYDARRPQSSVVLLDLHLPGIGGARGVAHVVTSGTRVLVVSAADARDDVIDAIAAGASGYLTKDAESSQIVSAVRVVAEGGTYVSPTLAAHFLAAAAEHPPSGSLALTEREKEVLALVAQGERDQDIAETLFISVRTVRSHLDRIRDKTGRRRRPDLTRLALESGIVPTTGQSDP